MSKPSLQEKKEAILIPQSGGNKNMTSLYWRKEYPTSHLAFTQHKTEIYRSGISIVGGHTLTDGKYYNVIFKAGIKNKNTAVGQLPSVYSTGGSGTLNHAYVITCHNNHVFPLEISTVGTAFVYISVSPAVDYVAGFEFYLMKHNGDGICAGSIRNTLNDISTVQINGSNMLQYTDSLGTNDIKQTAEHVWHHISYRKVSVTNLIFDLYVDGNLIGSGLGFANSVANINRFIFGGLSGTNVMHVDGVDSDLTNDYYNNRNLDVDFYTVWCD